MNGVLVILEYRGAWSRLSWEALAAGREVAETLHQPLLAAVAAGPGDDLAVELRTKSVERAYLEMAAAKKVKINLSSITKYVQRLADKRIILRTGRPTYAVQDPMFRAYIAARSQSQGQE